MQLWRFSQECDPDKTFFRNFRDMDSMNTCVRSPACQYSPASYEMFSLLNINIVPVQSWFHVALGDPTFSTSLMWNKGLSTELFMPDLLNTQLGCSPNLFYSAECWASCQPRAPFAWTYVRTNILNIVCRNLCFKYAHHVWCRLYTNWVSRDQRVD